MPFGLLLGVSLLLLCGCRLRFGFVYLWGLLLQWGWSQIWHFRDVAGLACVGLLRRLTWWICGGEDWPWRCCYRCPGTFCHLFSACYCLFWCSHGLLDALELVLYVFHLVLDLMDGLHDSSDVAEFLENLFSNFPGDSSTRVDICWCSLAWVRLIILSAI